MAEIDYAFLADFAKVDHNGTLTSIGASFTFVEASALPAVKRIAIAGRVRAQMTETEVGLRVSVAGPEDKFKITGTAVLSPGPDARPYGDGKVGHLFALDMDVPLLAEGLYEIEVQVDEGEPRRLAFELMVTPSGD